ncbi:serine/threonine protein kinase [Corynebacterium diphtheriae]|nr:serine/threonine protein kinase [Corynebacterium diphtheriae bv. mitis]OIS03523.1 serine/threonine protein kinase [Corynebacterium diphtheriae]MBG9302108.1 serine/threonine protein kinase [Corynebacterium diphtheriae bv. mitis]OJI01000.1 serine/threonine protein kinase [Corynebacterium diphtheriae]OSQ04645.1 serine/threonine protein kinase [Corynebacterium diphtheriae]
MMHVASIVFVRDVVFPLMRDAHMPKFKLVFVSTATALAVGFSGTAVVTAAPTQNTDVCTNSPESLKAMQRWSAATKAVKRAEGDKVVAATYAEMLAEAQQDLQVKTAEAAEKMAELDRVQGAVDVRRTDKEIRDAFQELLELAEADLASADKALATAMETQRLAQEKLAQRQSQQKLFEVDAQIAEHYEQKLKELQATKDDVWNDYERQEKHKQIAHAESSLAQYEHDKVVYDAMKEIIAEAEANVKAADEAVLAAQKVRDEAAQKVELRKKQKEPYEVDVMVQEEFAKKVVSAKKDYDAAVVAKSEAEKQVALREQQLKNYVNVDAELEQAQEALRDAESGKVYASLKEADCFTAKAPEKLTPAAESDSPQRSNIFLAIIAGLGLAGLLAFFMPVIAKFLGR